MLRNAVFEMVENLPGDPLIIRDVGPWNKYKTVTNDAENVVKKLVAQGMLFGRRRLLYYDSEGVLSELLIRDERFDGFGPTLIVKELV